MRDPEKHKASKKACHRRYLLTQRKWIDDLKVLSGCLFCGFNKHPAALVFHHKDKATKNGRVSQMHERRIGREKLDAEIKKCIVLCANCHAIFHAEGSVY